MKRENCTEKYIRYVTRKSFHHEIALRLHTSYFNYGWILKACFRGYSNFVINIAFHKYSLRVYFRRKYAMFGIKWNFSFKIDL